MQKLIAVKEAKALMNEALDWSVWGWLTEKRRPEGYRRPGVGGAGRGGEQGEGLMERRSPEGLARVGSRGEYAANRRMKRQYEKAQEESRDVDAEPRPQARS